MSALKTETRKMPPFVILTIEIRGGSRCEMNFFANCVAEGKVLELSGVATWKGLADQDWDCMIDHQSKERIAQAAKEGADVPAIVRSCEDQIANAILHEDPFRPELVSGMWLSLEDVLLIAGRVMAVWRLETTNGGNVVCSLPLLDEVGRQYDRDGMSQTLQWILRNETPIASLLPRLLASAEAEGRRLLDENNRGHTKIPSSVH